MLVSFHLASKFPDKMAALLDNLQATASDHSCFEVLVKIDAEDAAMNAYMAAEVTKRPFAVRFISTPRGAGYFDLWSAYNDLLKICHPDAYFVSLINDEVKFVTRDWDQVLDRYRGFYPDQMFRLRISQYRLRNYTDFWECGFAPDSYAIYTKRWFDIGGDWCPCNTPDSFQQSVAFYLTTATRPSPNNRQYNRDIPIWDIQLEGEVPYQGLSDAELKERVRLAEDHWFRLMSWTMQTDASHRAHRILAFLRAGELGLKGYSIESDIPGRCVNLIEQPSGRLVEARSYALSRPHIVATNRFRKPLFEYWCGGSWAVMNLHMHLRFPEWFEKRDRWIRLLRRSCWALRSWLQRHLQPGSNASAPGMSVAALSDGRFEPWGSAEENRDTYIYLASKQPFRARRIIVNLFSPAGRAHLKQVRLVGARLVDGEPADWKVIPARLRERDMPMPFQERVTVPPDPDFSRITLEPDTRHADYAAYQVWGLACLSASWGDQRNWLADGNGIYLRRLVVI